MLGTEAYQLSYSSIPFERVDTLDELFTALIESVESVEEQYRQLKLGKAKKNFDKEDRNMATWHGVARPLLYQLQSDFDLFASFWPNEIERAKILTIFNKLPRGKKLPNTHLNNLNTKLSNVHEVIDYLAEKYQSALRIQRFYRYTNNYLYVSPQHYIPIRMGSVSEIVLEKLFKNPSRRLSNDALIDLIARKLKISPYTPEYDKLADQLKAACRHINQKLAAIDVDYKTTKDLIRHDKSYTSVDMSMFRESYMKKID